MKPNYKEGDLVEIDRHDSWTLCISLRSGTPTLRECPAKELEVYSHPECADIFECIEGKVALILSIKRNLLRQSMGYRVLIEGHEMFCKSKVAEKYFKLKRTQEDESRRHGAVQDD